MDHRSTTSSIPTQTQTPTPASTLTNPSNRYKAATAEDDDDNPSGLTFTEKKQRMKEAMINNTPCGGGPDEDDECFNMLVRLSYLNQQSDGGSLGFRRSVNFRFVKFRFVSFCFFS